MTYTSPLTDRDRGARTHRFGSRSPGLFAQVSGTQLLIVNAGYGLAAVLAVMVGQWVLLREIAIYAGALFVPLAMAAHVWPGLGRVLLALAPSTPAIVLNVVLLVAATAATLQGSSERLVAGAAGALVTGLALTVTYPNAAREPSPAARPADDNSEEFRV